MSKEQFTLALPLLDDIQNRAVYTLSVIEQIQRGRIFVNDMLNPTATFITSSGGFYCLAGQEDDDNFNKFVVRYMNQKSNHNGFFALGLFSEKWNLELNKYSIDTSKKIQRSYYRFNQDRFNEEFTDVALKFDDGFEYIILNEEISNDYREKFYPYYKMVWDTTHHFCEFGVGHFLKRNNDLISVCTSPYIGGNYAEIDIITIEGYKRQGLATKLGVAFIRECLRRQLTPNWCCDSDNIESNNLAVKLGFEKIDEYPMYWYHT
ncbi:GNAT family N-acetyltransferase [Paenibacillus sp. FA6]|uniref:GNAT family N-acetyltransferase n=1 Tax=Paenibacillus sp. FA6 TaxID=3413029 RepID=UPI003F65E10B